MRLTGRVLAGVFAIAVLAAALVAGAVAGWMLRGEDGVDSARPADMPVEVVADLVERVLARGSTALTADEVRDLLAGEIDAQNIPQGLSRDDVEAIVAEGVAGTKGLGPDEVASIVSTVVEEMAGLDQAEVEAVVERLVEQSSGLSASEVEALVARLFAEAPVDDSGDEPVVAVADALRDLSLIHI